MIDPKVLVPLPATVPLVLAAFLAATAAFLPRRVADLLSIATTVCVGLVSGGLIYFSTSNPLVYWFGGWTPRGNVALGVSFVVDPIGAGFAALVCTLVLAALLFSWNYFDTIGTLYHVLMMVFLGAMCGFCLTGDIFNLFVWFELMSAAAYALCAYKIEEAGPLQGGFNFAVMNTIGAFLVLCGIGLLYGHTGALNMAQIGRSLGTRMDAVVIVAFVFILCGFYVKAAAFPFHFWLADAHAVAPTPVCILFSGVMVELGLYGVARVYWAMMDGPFGAHHASLMAALLVMGTLTALLGAIMCFGQRHIKRLLAFSTVSHIGLLIIGFAFLDPGALGGAALYTIGHAMVKSALFLASGILLHRFGTVDELELYRRGHRLPWVGFVFFFGALGLSGLPTLPTFLGDALIEERAAKVGQHWVPAVFFIAGVLTSGAVLRVGARIFGRHGRAGDEELPGARKIEEGRETGGPHNRTPMGMLIPAVGLIVLGIAIGLIPGLLHANDFAAYDMADSARYQARVLDGAILPAHLPEEHHELRASLYRSFVASACAILLALFSLSKYGLHRRARFERWSGFILRPLRALHSGHIGDYVAFFTFGVAAFGGLLVLLLHLL